MKPLGQHFLKNPALIEKIIAALDIHIGETIIEIGPGHGELTILLAEACASLDAKIIAIEKDEKLATALRGKIETLKIENVEIVGGDALLVLQTVVSGVAAASSATPFKIAGNIPYYITGHLLRVVSELAMKPERCIFMIQAEVAERIRAVPPRMNRLAASVQFWATPKTIAHVAKTDFSPPPEVDSAVIQLDAKKLPSELRGAENAERYYAAVRMLFAQPRKTILNNLAATGGTKAALSEQLISIGIIPESRPQNLTIENIGTIAEKFFS